MLRAIEHCLNRTNRVARDLAGRCRVALTLFLMLACGCAHVQLASCRPTESRYSAVIGGARSLRSFTLLTRRGTHLDRKADRLPLYATILVGHCKTPLEDRRPHSSAHRPSSVRFHPTPRSPARSLLALVAVVPMVPAIGAPSDVPSPRWAVYSPRSDPPLCLAATLGCGHAAYHVGANLLGAANAATRTAIVATPSRPLPCLRPLSFSARQPCHHSQCRHRVPPIVCHGHASC